MTPERCTTTPCKKQNQNPTTGQTGQEETAVAGADDEPPPGPAESPLQSRCQMVVESEERSGGSKRCARVLGSILLHQSPRPPDRGRSVVSLPLAFLPSANRSVL